MLAERLGNWFRDPPENSLFVKTRLGKELFCLNSDLGIKRNENQDRTAALFVNSGGRAQHSFYCFVLCDGMGGMEDGSIAASISVSTFIDSLVQFRNEHPEQRLLKSALASNDAVGNSRGGGSTLSAILFSERAIFSLNVGDSRIYSKTRDGVVNRHTTDDNLKEFAGGEDERLLQFIGIGEGLRPHIKKIDTNFDYIFLTSDGVHSLESKVFDSIVKHSNSCSELCERLVSSAVWTGGHDNASVIGISNALGKQLGPDRLGPEIAVWSNSSEMQIIWAERDQKKDSHYEDDDNSGLRKSKNREDKFGPVEKDELPLEGGKDKKKTPARKKKKKGTDTPKDTFGDFE